MTDFHKWIHGNYWPRSPFRPGTGPLPATTVPARILWQDPSAPRTLGNLTLWHAWLTGYLETFAGIEVFWDAWEDCEGYYPMATMAAEKAAFRYMQAWDYDPTSLCSADPTVCHGMPDGPIWHWGLEKCADYRLKLDKEQDRCPHCGRRMLLVIWPATCPGCSYWDCQNAECPSIDIPF